MNAHAALILTDGGQGVYDTVADLTWVSNGNLLKAQADGYPGGPAAYFAAVIAASNGSVAEIPNAYDGYTGSYTLSASDFFPVQNNGGMTWWGAQAWVHYLNVTNYGGSNQWSLPSTVDANTSLMYPDGIGADPSPSTSQMAQLFYGNLGQVAKAPILNHHNANYSLFSNLQDNAYWSGTEYAANPGGAWTFATAGGLQNVPYKEGGAFAIAVSKGLVNTVNTTNTFVSSGRQLTVPLAQIGGAIYSNMVVTVDKIVSGPSGAMPQADTVDSYDPSNKQLTVPSVAFGGQTLYGVVGTVSGLVSIGSVRGADSFDGTYLTIPAVQLQGGGTYLNVVIVPGPILSIAGGMPQAVVDQYNLQNKQLLIPAVTYQGRVYTNVTITVATVLSVGK